MKSYSTGEIDSMTDSVQTAWGQFSDKFAFHFRKLRDDDGIAEWKKLVEQCDLQTLLKCLDVIAESWDHKFGIPRGHSVLKSYKEAMGRTSMRVEGESGFWCPKCQNSGALWLIYYEIRQNEQPQRGALIKKINDVRCVVLHPSEKTTEHKRLKTCPVTCVCKIGIGYGTHSMKGQDTIYNVPDCDYWEWGHKGQMEAFDWIDRQGIQTNHIQNVEMES